MFWHLGQSIGQVNQNQGIFFYLLADRNIMKAMLHEALNNPHSSETESDMFVNVVQEVNTTPEDVDADMFSVCVGGFHTTTFCKCLHNLP